MAEPIISVSGLRGIVGESLTPEVAVRYAAAFSACLPAGPIVISRDSRPSGSLLSELIGGTLRAAGRSVIQADIAATPTTGVLIRHTGATGGIQISASHNPSEYNGMKLFSSDGRVIPASAGEEVINKYRSMNFSWANHTDLGGESITSDANQVHSELLFNTIDVQRIRERTFTVLLDSNHGAGGILGEFLLKELGCELKLLGGSPNGQFSHTPEPTAENLTSVCKQVTDAKADIGFCQDPDADRLAVIDERGRYIGEEYTLALCLDHVLQQQKGAVVTNCATSKMSEEIANKHDANFFRSAVGEANVVDMMLRHDAVFGGEGNGGPIDPRVGLVRDSFVGIALILDSLATQDCTISQWVNELPRYEIHKTKVSVDRERIPDSFDRLESEFSSASADRLDGLRLDWPDKWLLIRSSNTEPIVRVIAEATSKEEATRLCDEAAELIS